MEAGEQIRRLRAALLGEHEVRRTPRQKRAFIEWVKDYGASIGLPVTVEESGKWLPVRNIVLGDVNRARTIIAAHYDTCAWMPFGAGITPGCWPVLVLIELAQLLVLPLLLLLMFLGFPNPHTANDNTSGVMLTLLLAARMRDRTDVAFVLFDQEEQGLLGSAALIRAHPQVRRRFMLNLDCVGDGDTLLVTGSKPGMQTPQAKRLLEAVQACAPDYGMRTVSGPFPRWVYPSDQMLFARGTAIAALKGRRVLYMNRIHTARDTRLDDRNLLCLLAAVSQALGA